MGKKEHMDKYDRTHPWSAPLCSARYRCNNPNARAYRFYGAKGIKCFLTIRQVEYIWKRDCASHMRKPSIDRIDSKGNYTMANCRFVELRENSRRAVVDRVGIKPTRLCVNPKCGERFIYSYKEQKCCSRKCSNHLRKGKGRSSKIAEGIKLAYDKKA